MVNSPNVEQSTDRVFGSFLRKVRIARSTAGPAYVKVVRLLGGSAVASSRSPKVRTRASQQRSTLGWTPEPSYEKPDISVQAMGLYHRIVAPLMLPWIERRLLNLLRCTENKCFFQRNR